jgi:aspartate carbamoyltransferase regulatory subunit
MSETKTDEKRLYVEKIRNGTVIDHIKSGFAFSVMKILGLDGSSGHLITVGINVKSNSAANGKKDIVKVENVHLEQKQINQIALLSPDCKVSFIEDYKVKEKFVVEVPPVFHGIIDCPNARCISRQEREPIVAEFKILSKDPLKIACGYCGWILDRQEILKLVIK